MLGTKFGGGIKNWEGSVPEYLRGYGPACNGSLRVLGRRIRLFYRFTKHYRWFYFWWIYGWERHFDSPKTTLECWNTSSVSRSLYFWFAYGHGLWWNKALVHGLWWNKRLFGIVHLTFTPKMFKINVKALQQKLRDFIVKWTRRHETHRFFSG